VSRTPAQFTQADVARILRAARQVGAREAEVKLQDGTTVTVKLTEAVELSTDRLAPVKEIVL
jgi:hypothetical protein